MLKLELFLAGARQSFDSDRGNATDRSLNTAAAMTADDPKFVNNRGLVEGYAAQTDFPVDFSVRSRPVQPDSPETTTTDTSKTPRSLERKVDVKIVVVEPSAVVLNLWPMTEYSNNCEIRMAV